MCKYVRAGIGVSVCLVVCLLGQNVLSDEIGYEFAKESAGDVIAAKGASEAIADLCHLGEAEMEDLSRAVRSMADVGLRVLGVAKAYFK